MMADTWRPDRCACDQPRARVPSTPSAARVERMTRVAAVDCGTNSLRLLIADVADGRLTDVVRTMTVVRLGQGVDKTGEFAADALDRTFAAVDEAAALCREHGVESPSALWPPPPRATHATASSSSMA